MKIVFLDAKTLGADIDLSGFSELGAVTIHDMTADSEAAARLADCDVAVVNKVKLNSSNLAGAKNLKLICETATGYDNIDCAYCGAHGIAVCNVTAYSTDSVTQVTIAMALSLMTHLREYDDYVKDGRYTRSGIHNQLSPYFHELRGLTWGIAGLGNIGRGVAAVAQAFGCRVLAYKRTPEPGYTCVPLETLCREADILSVHLPLMPETERLFDAEKIGMMKPNAIFINVARGAVADEEALVQAVEQGKIGGLGIDVYSAEPMAQDSPYQRILHRDNVVFTPHMAWAAHEARVRCMRIVRENIVAFFNGTKQNRVV